MKNYTHSILFFLFTLVLFGLSGCSKDTTDPAPGGDPYLALQGDVQPGPADGGEVSVLFATNRSWSVTAELPAGEAGGWFAITPRRGKAGERIAVKVRMEPNGESRARRLTLVVRAASLVERIEVTQAKKNTIIAGDGWRKIGSERQTLVVEVVGGGEYDVAVKAGSAWIREVFEPDAAEKIREQTRETGAPDAGDAASGMQGFGNAALAEGNIRTGTAAHAGAGMRTGAGVRMGTAANAGASGSMRTGTAAHAGAGMRTGKAAAGMRGVGSGANSVAEAGTGTSAGWTREREAGAGTSAGWMREREAGTGTSAGWTREGEAGTGTSAGWTREGEAGAGASAGWMREGEAGTGTSAGWTREGEAAAGTSAGWTREEEAGTGADAAAWMREDGEGYAAGEVRRHRFAIAANPDAQERTGTIVFTDRVSGLMDELTVVQAAWEDTDPDPERTALRTFYETTGGGSWTRSDNWCSDRPLAEWYGVETDAEGHVTALRLPQNNLRGTIPQRIGALTHLRHLELPRNALEGEFNYYDELTGWHSVFEMLTALETIDLSHNALTGEIFMSLLKRLRRVDLSSNHLTGTVIPIQWAPLYENGRYIDVILNNNHFNDVQDFIVNHPQWSRIALQFIRQTVMIRGNSLIGGMRCENVYMPDFTFTDLRDGTQHSMQALYKRNKLTMLLQWDPTQEDSNTFAQTVVRRLHTLYGAQGFAVAAFIPEGEAYRKAAEKYLQTHEAAWHVVAEYADAEGRRVILPTEPYPGLLLLDQDGKVVENLCSGMRYAYPLKNTNGLPATTDLAARPYDISDMLNLLFKSTFEKCEYVSTDYSKDKQYETLQKATRGKGIDLVLIGDAFTDIDIETGFYRQVMEFAMEAFFELEPTKSYREYFNVYSVNAVSRNAHIGEDRSMSALRIRVDDSRPGHIDPIQSIMNEYLWVCPPSSCRYPAVIINGHRYGVTHLQMYSGGQNYSFQGYLPTSKETMMRTFQHETVGHLFGHLDDEYFYAANELIPEAEKQELRRIHEKGYYLNVSLTNDPAAVPWAHLIGNPRFPRTGVFQGGHYYKKGVWRSEPISMMDESRQGFLNAISRELIVKEILELSGEGYTFEKFLAKDKDDYPTGGTTDRSRTEHPKLRHFPPVILD